jgi:hypothetical protein
MDEVDGVDNMDGRHVVPSISLLVHQMTQRALKSASYVRHCSAVENFM